MCLGLAASGTLATGATAQSSHLVLLESTSPATAADPITAIVSPGWAGLWSNPSADPRLTGAMVGGERNGFGAVRTVFAQVAARAGVRWSLALAQTSVADLFDRELLDQDPTLDQLRAGALTLTGDAALKVSRRLCASLGVRYEADELLGITSDALSARGGVTGALGRGISIAATAERVVSTEAGTAGPGRISLAAASSSALGPIELTVSAGARTGDLWRAQSHSASVRGSVSARLLRVVTLGGALGREQDPYGDGSWVRATTWWAGVAVGPVSIHARLASRPGEAEPILGIAVALTANQ